MVRKKRFALVLLAFVLVQCCVLHRFGYLGARLDLLLILAFYVGLTANQPAVPGTCLVVGLFRDMFSVEPFGVGMLLCLAMGTVVFVARGRYFSEKALVRAAIAFAIICCFTWAYGVLLMLGGANVDLGAWLRFGTVHALMTALPTPLACRLLDGLGVIRPHHDF
jgi:rod shape-determining protein MreD